MLDGALVLQNVSMSDFGDLVGSMIGQGVVDMTGIKGVFDLRLNVDFAQVREKFAGDPAGLKSAAAEVLLSAMEEQIGLKLERRKIPLEMLIIDQGNKVPTEN